MARSSRRADIRIGHDARASATGRLDTALREGRLDLAEYERRLVVIQAARVHQDLTPAVVDLPVHSGQTGPGLRISAADRDAALVRLADALTDGRIEAAAYADAEELLNRAVTYADVDAVVGNLDARASVAEREQAIARIEAAVAGGLLEPAERDARVAAVRSATRDAQLAALVADLSADTRSPGAPLRASNADREAVAARLHDAVEAGFLDVTEFDERVRAVYAARLSGELARLVADLPATARPPAPLPAAPPVEIPPRPRSGSLSGAIAAIVVHVTVGIVAFGAGVAVLVANGHDALGVLLIVVWLIVLTVLAIRGRRAAAAELAAPRAVEWIPRVAGPRAEVADYFAATARRAVTQRPELAGHRGFVRALACLVLPDGTPVAVSGANDNTAMVWDLATYSLLHTLSGHTHDVVGVAATVLPDGVPVAVTVSGDRTARVWDIRDGSQRGTLPDLAGDPRSVACFTMADGTPAAVSLSYDAVQMWDLRDLRMLRRFKVDYTTEAIVPMVLPGGEPVAAVMRNDVDRFVEVMSLKSGRRRFRMLGHTDSLTAIDATVLPDGTPVAVSVSHDKTVRVWDLRRGALLHAVTGMISEKRAVVCTSLPDGTPVMAASGYDDAQVWNLRDGAEVGTLDLTGGPIAGLALPDRTLILGPGVIGFVVDVHPLS